MPDLQTHPGSGSITAPWGDQPIHPFRVADVDHGGCGQSWWNKATFSSAIELTHSPPDLMIFGAAHNLDEPAEPSQVFIASRRLRKSGLTEPLRDMLGAGPLGTKDPTYHKKIMQHESRKRTNTSQLRTRRLADQPRAEAMAGRPRPSRGDALGNPVCRVNKIPAFIRGGCPQNCRWQPSVAFRNSVEPFVRQSEALHPRRKFRGSLRPAVDRH